MNEYEFVPLIMSQRVHLQTRFNIVLSSATAIHLLVCILLAIYQTIDSL